ncbi:hypothetical protein [Flavobacterium sp. NRK1]|uniref:hypothetical protein n=1 Tax=Flavobacterium sp. NRK1 TaxID=2954929 RepID=UPI0020923499|nr:hypothetical protein [Flavobacterium sp. NRK1]MCO6148582.1 hypothetical protein [Flavobacterium sp. NRK1]
MLQNIDLAWILIPFIIGAIIYPRIVKHRTGDPLRDKLKDMQIMLIMFGVLMAVLLFSLPMTPSLSTFGYPETVEEIATPEKVLKLLQRYNKAIVRTTEVLHWLLFISIFWFVGSMWQLMKIMMQQRDKELIKNDDEKVI